MAQMLAGLQGCQSATLVPSTLHLYWDLFGLLADDRVAIYVDAGAYPIVRWGIERAAARGVLMRNFPHHDADALERLLKQDAHRRSRPLVVSDGFCPGCGRAAPITAYLKISRIFGGRLVLDDTQALGIFGHSPGPNAPYGRGGGGMLRWNNVESADVLVGSSLAKAFGVPVAVLSGSNVMVQHFEAKSETRVHCSPPSTATIHAAEHALAINRERGDALRLRLAQLVRRFHNRLTDAGFHVTGGLFPVQTLAPVPGLDAATLHERLLRSGVRTVLRCGAHSTGPCVSFLITSSHRSNDIDRAVDALTYATRTQKATNRVGGVL
jgi:8-amino-7-oxononanoate synthase